MLVWFSAKNLKKVLEFFYNCRDGEAMFFSDREEFGYVVCDSDCYRERGRADALYTYVIEPGAF